MISIIIPIYNVERYILDCLTSIKKQTYKEIEVICIDDCGTDSSINLVKEFIKENPDMNVRIINHEYNQGLSVARNTGISVATGQYTMFLDSDDMLVQDSIKKIIPILETNNLDILDCEIIEIYEKKEITLNLSVCKKPNTKIITGKEFYVEMIKSNNYVPVVWNKIYNTSFLKQFTFVPRLISEDEDFTIRVLMSSDRVQHLSTELYIYRRREGSIMSQFNKNGEWIKSYIYIIGTFEKLISNETQPIVKKCLATRVNQIGTSLIKNCVQYKVTRDIQKDAIIQIKEKEVYLLGRNCYGRIERIQSYLLKYPRLFKYLYKVGIFMKTRGGKTC